MKITWEEAWDLANKITEKMIKDANIVNETLFIEKLAILIFRHDLDEEA